jgi:hypothetical protein
MHGVKMEYLDGKLIKEAIFPVEIIPLYIKQRNEFQEDKYGKDQTSLQWRWLCQVWRKFGGILTGRSVLSELG